MYAAPSALASVSLLLSFVQQLRTLLRGLAFLQFGWYTGANAAQHLHQVAKEFCLNFSIAGRSGHWELGTGKERANESVLLLLLLMKAMAIPGVPRRPARPIM